MAAESPADKRADKEAYDVFTAEIGKGSGTVQFSKDIHLFHLTGDRQLAVRVWEALSSHWKYLDCLSVLGHRLDSFESKDWMDIRTKAASAKNRTQSGRGANQSTLVHHLATAAPKADVVIDLDQKDFGSQLIQRVRPLVSNPLQDAVLKIETNLKHQKALMVFCVINGKFNHWEHEMEALERVHLKYLAPVPGPVPEKARPRLVASEEEEEEKAAPAIPNTPEELKSLLKYHFKETHTKNGAALAVAVEQRLKVIGRSLGEFKKLELIIITPTRISLRNQTQQRLEACGVIDTESTSVWMTNVANTKLKADVDALTKRVIGERDTLFVVVQDEAHWGINVAKDKKTDKEKVGAVAKLMYETLQKDQGNLVHIGVSATIENHLVLPAALLTPQQIVDWQSCDGLKKYRGEGWYRTKFQEIAADGMGSFDYLADRWIQQMGKTASKREVRPSLALLFDYYFSLGGTAAFSRELYEKYSTPETREICQEVLHTSLDGRGVMAVVRVKQQKVADHMGRMLKAVQKHLGLDRKFAVMVDTCSETAIDPEVLNCWKKLPEHFKAQVRHWRRAKDPHFRDAKQFSDLEGLPCILILVMKGKMGDTFPVSMKYFDVRGYYYWPSDKSLTTARSTFLQDIGRTFRYSPAAKEDMPALLLSQKMLQVFVNDRFKKLDDKITRKGDSASEFIGGDDEAESEEEPEENADDESEAASDRASESDEEALAGVPYDDPAEFDIDDDDDKPLAPQASGYPRSPSPGYEEDEEDKSLTPPASLPSGGTPKPATPLPSASPTQSKPPLSYYQEQYRPSKSSYFHRFTDTATHALAVLLFRRFIAFRAEPQVGKTGSFLWLVWLLRMKIEGESEAIRATLERIRRGGCGCGGGGAPDGPLVEGFWYNRKADVVHRSKKCARVASPELHQTLDGFQKEQYCKRCLKHLLQVPGPEDDSAPVSNAAGVWFVNGAKYHRSKKCAGAAATETSSLASNHSLVACGRCCQAKAEPKPAKAAVPSPPPALTPALSPAPSPSPSAVQPPVRGSVPALNHPQIQPSPMPSPNAVPPSLAQAALPPSPASVGEWYINGSKYHRLPKCAGAEAKRVSVLPSNPSPVACGRCCKDAKESPVPPKAQVAPMPTAPRAAPSPSPSDNARGPAPSASGGGPMTPDTLASPAKPTHAKPNAKEPEFVVLYTTNTAFHVSEKCARSRAKSAVNTVRERPRGLSPCGRCARDFANRT